MTDKSQTTELSPACLAMRCHAERRCMHITEGCLMPPFPLSADTTREWPETANGLNITALRNVLARVDDIGGRIAHHLPHDGLHLTLDEACSLSALLYRVTVQGKVP